MQERNKTGKMSGVKKQFYRPRQHGKTKYFLEAGQRGYFCTCNFREKDCVKEAYNLLNEYGDKLYGSSINTKPPPEETPSQADSEGEDISDQLKKEIEQMRSDSKKNISERRFQAVDTGASNCVFIRTNLPKPEEITNAIFKELLETKLAKTRFLLRIVPIMATCKTNLSDITDTAGKLFDEHFLKEPSTFSIVFNKRFHNKVSRDDVIRELADLIALKNSGNKADLKNPQKAVIVEIIKGICLISVVDNYYLYRKYNMFEICKKDEDKSAEKTDKADQVEVAAAEKGDSAETGKAASAESCAQETVDEDMKCVKEEAENNGSERGDGDAK